MKKVVCIGSATRDIFVPLKEVRVIDNQREITAKKLMAFEYGAKIYADSLVETVGGSAVNVAAGLALAGYRTFVFSRTSKDEIGKWIAKQISKLKVKKNYLQQNGRQGAEVSVVVVEAKSSEHFILRTGDSVNEFDMARALDKFREKVDWIFVGSQKQNWQDKMASIIEFAKRKKARIAFNPSGYQIANQAIDLRYIFSSVDLIFLNRDEAIELVQNIEGMVTDEPEELLNKIHDYGAAVVSITDGENGAYVSDRNRMLHLGTAAKVKVDSVGAGDAFCSGFLAAYMESEDIEQALLWGIANSGKVISRFGGTSALLAKEGFGREAASLAPLIKEL